MRAPLIFACTGWTGESGLAAIQRSDPDGVDIVDIYAVSPGLLGTVVADSVGLVGAGAHARIAVGCDDRLPAPPEMVDEYDDFGFPMRHTGSQGPAVHTMDGPDVVAIGTVQSRYDPARHWGVLGDRNDQCRTPMR